ncbi:MAG TPA: ATP-dependent zinc metalloprotease FtsH, partial [Atribacter sp.]|nr:ATP-dependent zinc metalloprotease FtsH [Atribacter sp.]
ELSEVVDFLKNPRKFQKLGARIPRGVLLYGPPGTGKTLLAKAVAGEAGVPFFSISGSDFVEMFVGVGAARVRDLFGNAKRNAPCIIFVDELDAVGRHRGAGLGGGHDEREQTLNQLLVEMDGFDPNQGVILIAATNRPDILDPALLRPGRFDRRIAVPRPDVLGREAILKVHTKGKPLGKDIDLKILARRTPGFVGADLANMMNEAALLAARKGKDVIEMSDMEESIDKVIAGPERKNVIISDKEKKVVAYHESGHALVARFLPNTDPVHKISIIPRGGAALGYTLQLPTEDRYLISKQELMTRLAVLLGGRVAEEIVFEDITTGAHDDLQKATEIAREMVCEYGMSDTLGPLTLGRRHKEVFLGKDIAEDRNYSEEVAFTIDKEVRSIIDSAYEQARKLIIDNRDKLDKLTAILLEKEVLEREEIDKILDINGNEIPEFSSEEDKNKQAAAEQLLSDFPSNQEGRINTK